MRRAPPGLAALSVACAGAAAWPYTVDDAFILARYARRIAGGLGYTFVDGPPTDGVTGPLGLVPGLLGELALGDPVLGAKLAGVLASAAAAAWVAWCAGREGPGRGLTTALLIACWPLLGLWGAAGLETGLTTLACTGVAVGLVERRGALLGASVACLAWLRPEAALPCLAALVMLFLPCGGGRPSPAPAATRGLPLPRRLMGAAARGAPTPLADTLPRTGRTVLIPAVRPPPPRRLTGAGEGEAPTPLALTETLPRKEAARGAPAPLCTRRIMLAWGIAGAGALAVVAFRLALFAEPLPLGLAAKPPDLALGLGYAGRALLLALGGLGLVPLGLAAREPEGPGRRLVALIAVAASSIVLAGGDWMPGFRLFVPWLPVTAWAMSGPIARRWPGRRAAAALLFASATAIPALAGGIALFDARAAGQTRESDGAALAAWLAEHTDRVALVDVGYLVYAAGVDVVDLGGVTDPEVARLPGGHADKRIDAGWLLARAPDAIVVFVREGRPQHPVERRVLGMPWVAARWGIVHSQRYGPSASYVVLRP